MKNSIILDTDSYKVSMWKQYPAGTEYVYSYIESRGGKYDRTEFLGVQALVKYLATPITQEDIDYADKIWTLHGEPFNRVGWQYILDKHNGKLPNFSIPMPMHYGKGIDNAMFIKIVLKNKGYAKLTGSFYKLNIRGEEVTVQGDKGLTEYIIANLKGIREFLYEVDAFNPTDVPDDELSDESTEEKKSKKSKK